MCSDERRAYNDLAEAQIHSTDLQQESRHTSVRSMKPHGTVRFVVIRVMGRPHEVAKLIKEGKAPSQAAAHLGISTSSVAGYLKTAVGSGLIRESEIVFAVPLNVRNAVNQALIPPQSRKHKTPPPLRIVLYKSGLSNDEIEDGLVYSSYREALVAMGDMYELIYRFETKLHSFVKEILIHAFGPDADSGWWRKGVDDEIRKKCAVRREDDPYPAGHPFQYTDLIDLWKILKRNWKLCENVFHPEVVQGKTKTV